MQAIAKMRMKKAVDRSVLQGDNYKLFRAAIKSPATRHPYERKLVGFLKTTNLTTTEELAKLASLVLI